MLHTTSFSTNGESYARSVRPRRPSILCYVWGQSLAIDSGERERETFFALANCCVYFMYMCVGVSFLTTSAIPLSVGVRWIRNCLFSYISHKGRKKVVVWVFFSRSNTAGRNLKFFFFLSLIIYKRRRRRTSADLTRRMYNSFVL